MNFKEIIQAWAISFNPTEEESKKANERIEICNECPSRKFNRIFQIYVCNECGCPLSKKIYSSENSCPLKKWKN